MKLDNPQLTAFVLGELSPAEQAILEQEIGSDREISAEIDETKEIARILRAGLSAEPAGRLAEHQRDAIFREARILAEEKLAAADSTATPFSPLVVPRDTWWNRPGPWQAIAACAVAGFAAYAMLINNGQDPARALVRNNGELLVPVPTDMVSNAGGVANPDLVSPTDRQGDSFLPPVAGSDPGTNLTSVPNADSVKPEVKIDVPTHIPPGSKSPQSDPKSTVVIDKDALKDWRNGASVGKPDKKEIEVDENVAKYLRERMSEAEKLREGTTYEVFSKTFKPVAGADRQYEMIRVPSIKVEATFVPGSVPNQGAKVSPDARLKSISKPYLE